jgi:hypothetical protein
MSETVQSSLLGRSRVRLAALRPRRKVRRRTAVAAQETLPAARPFIRRWLTAGMLMVASIVVILYVSNAIAVNDLLAKITSIEHERDGIRSENERLRAELLRLMSVRRVTSLATERLGMVQPARPPVAVGAERRPVAAPATN